MRDELSKASGKRTRDTWSGSVEPEPGHLDESEQT